LIGAVAVPITFRPSASYRRCILEAEGLLSPCCFPSPRAAGLPSVGRTHGLFLCFPRPVSVRLADQVVVIGYLTARLLPKYPFWPALGATAFRRHRRWST
jgi:biotin transport system substrate-specific component